jgi:hypothetical protein
VEGERFDELSRALAQASRRSLLRGLAGMAGAAVAACTPSRRPSKPPTATERFGKAGPGLAADSGDCDPEVVKSCITAAYNREETRLSDCLTRCEALREPEQEQARAACFEWVSLMAQRDVRQCHAQICGAGRVCRASQGEPLIHACCPPHSVLIADSPSSWRCLVDTCGSIVCDPPFVLDEEYCYCKCNDTALAVECGAGTIFDPRECRCV